MGLLVVFEALASLRLHKRHHAICVCPVKEDSLGNAKAMSSHSSKFFNNTAGNTLFDKLKGIASNMATFDRFLAVVGFFRSSGYFKLRKELGDISEIKILVGINIDDIFRKHNKSLLMLADEEKAKEIYQTDFKDDIINAQ